MHPAILTDLTKCIGCEACVHACREVNELPRGGDTATLSAKSWTAVEHRDGIHVRRQCMHCLDPACASVCPVAALHKTPEGPVLYDESRCIGCRYCMVACPFGVPKYEWDSALPRVQKCILCFERRLKDGLQPACTAACPTGATVFGDRDALIADARGRLAAHPERYVDHVYGLSEAGGTSVLYLSSVPFAQLGFKVLPNGDPYPRLTWDVLSRLPTVVSVGGVLLLGIWWLSNRRVTLEQVARGEISAEQARREHPPLVAERDDSVASGRK